MKRLKIAVMMGAVLLAGAAEAGLSMQTRPLYRRTGSRSNPIRDTRAFLALSRTSFFMFGM